MSRFWFPTRSGITFDLLTPHGEMIEWDDIATALSKQCRFNGHCKGFYSVAEHCYHAASLLPPKLAPYGLLHDAHEAYIGDMIAPLKRALDGLSPSASTALKTIEARIDRLIYEKAGLPFPTTDMEYQVKEADLRMLATERRDLFTEEAWAQATKTHEPAEFNIYGWDAEYARKMWCASFERLIGPML